jgi:phytoene/squalene synthetase
MKKKPKLSQSLAEDITRSASKQTYYTIRFLADRDLVPDAYRAYAYFRWVDDILDSPAKPISERIAFLQRQQSLLEACYGGETQGWVCAEEQMLVDLVRNDTEKNSGLQSYLRNMMAVMEFDVARRGRLISQVDLSAYSRMLASAVTEALYYFIGHNCPSPCDESRYLAVQGAHIIHMLRDMGDDAAIGYFNIPIEVLEAKGLSIQSIDHPSFRKWVRDRVDLARSYFRIGLESMARVKSLRCRLAGYAYIARFQWLASIIEQEGYRLRDAYPERKSLRASIWMVWTMVSYATGLNQLFFNPHKAAAHSVSNEER